MSDINEITENKEKNMSFPETHYCIRLNASYIAEKSSAVAYSDFAFVMKDDKFLLKKNRKDCKELTFDKVVDIVDYVQQYYNECGFVEVNVCEYFIDWRYDNFANTMLQDSFSNKVSAYYTLLSEWILDQNKCVTYKGECNIDKCITILQTREQTTQNQVNTRILQLAKTIMESMYDVA